MASVRLLLQIVVQYDLLIHHMDVKSAYLNVPLDYEIYVEPPESFNGKNGNYFCKLKKTLIWVKTEWSKLEQNIPYLFNYTKFLCNHLSTLACMFKMSTIKYQSFYDIYPTPPLG